MKFFFPDSQDMIDQSFDFAKEKHSEWRIRQRDDVYPHEVFQTPPYDGILVSKAIVDGTGDKSGKYTLAQRHRLRRLGVKAFFRIHGKHIQTMGDCGAFTYVNEETPPYTCDEVVEFYEDCGFDYGLSIDHVILGYQQKLDNQLPGMDMVPEAWRQRQEITFEYADEFLRRTKAGGSEFTPIGVAQGWSPQSYTKAVVALQKMGYRYVALGGMVPLRTPDILRCLETINPKLCNDSRLHLLGISRFDNFNAFQKYGVASFDNTSPLRQAFMDDRDNYYTPDRTYTALRVPQSQGNPKLSARIQSGELDQAEIRALENNCLRTLNGYNEGSVTLGQTLEALLAYEEVHNPDANRLKIYREVLHDRPWDRCSCEICQEIGIQILIFRGAERNKRRGFHNLSVFHKRLGHIVSDTGSAKIESLSVDALS